MKAALRWSAPLVVAIAFVAIDRARTQADPPKPGGPVDVLFAPTGKDHGLEEAIEGELDRARKTVDVAMYQFTSTSIGKKLEDIRKRVKVRILFDADQAEHARKDAPNRTLPGVSGIDTKFVDLGGGSGADAPKFHHKFCVIDGETTITGSYNWTVLGDESNHENLLIIHDTATARKYATQFEKIWSDAKLAKAPEKQAGDGK